MAFREYSIAHKVACKRTQVSNTYAVEGLVRRGVVLELTGVIEEQEEER